jgi:hypothetical protein
LEDALKLDRRIMVLQERTEAYSKRQFAGLEQRSKLTIRFKTMRWKTMAYPDFFPCCEKLFKQALIVGKEKLEYILYMKLMNILICFYNRRMASLMANIPSSEYTTIIRLIELGTSMSIKELISELEKILTTQEQFITHQEKAFGIAEEFLKEIISPELVHPHSEKTKEQTLQSWMDLANQMN